MDTAEERLRHAQKMEGIGRLAGGIAHDFNNLLTAIIGYTDMILEQIGPDKPISADLQEIRKAADRAAALTRQLLAFGRKQRFNVTVIDVNETVDSMRAMLQRLLGEDLQFIVDLAADLPIHADRVQLEQVIMNLVVNARDAMPKGGLLMVRTRMADEKEASAATHQHVEPGEYLKLSVSDTGVGMDPHTASHIFEPFFTTKEMGKGTGLGLATVYGVVQQLGGHIAVSSAPGEGTTFDLFFPTVVAPPTEESDDPERFPAPVAEQREAVLVVEDQIAVRQLVSRVLTRHGYHVLEGSTGAEGLMLADGFDGSIDLVLSDVVMPTMDGPEMVEKLRMTRPAIRVLYMSGYTGEAIARRGGLSPHDTILQKPFTATGLLKSIREALV